MLLGDVLTYAAAREKLLDNQLVLVGNIIRGAQCRRSLSEKQGCVRHYPDYRASLTESVLNVADGDARRDGNKGLFLCSRILKRRDRLGVVLGLNG